MGKQWKQWETIFLGLQNHWGCDGSHEIKRHLLLRRNAMTNLDSVLKRRDIALLTKVFLIKVTVFPVVIYRCESWTIKMAECWSSWTVVLEKTPESPLDCKGIKPVNPKGNQPYYSLEGLLLNLKLQYFGYLMWRADSLEKNLMLGKIEGKRRKGQQRMKWLDRNTNSEFEQTPEVQKTVEDRRAWSDAVHGVQRVNTT